MDSTRWTGKRRLTPMRLALELAALLVGAALVAMIGILASAAVQYAVLVIFFERSPLW